MRGEGGKEWTQEGVWGLGIVGVWVWKVWVEGWVWGVYRSLLGSEWVEGMGIEVGWMRWVVWIGIWVVYGVLGGVMWGRRGEEERRAFYRGSMVGVIFLLNGGDVVGSLMELMGGEMGWVRRWREPVMELAWVWGGRKVGEGVAEALEVEVGGRKEGVEWIGQWGLVLWYGSVIWEVMRMVRGILVRLFPGAGVVVKWPEWPWVPLWVEVLVVVGIHGWVAKGVWKRLLRVEEVRGWGRREWVTWIGVGLLVGVHQVVYGVVETMRWGMFPDWGTFCYYMGQGLVCVGGVIGVLWKRKR